MNNRLFLCSKEGISPRKDAKVRLDSPGFFRGHGLFETILIINRKPVLLEMHLDRMLASASFLSLIFPPRDMLIEEIIDFTSQTNAKKSALRLTLFQSNSPNKCYIGLTRRKYPYLSKDFRVGYSARFAHSLHDQNNPLLKHKTLNCLQHFLEKQAAQGASFDECIFINIDDNVCEASTSNIFIYDGNSILTPPVEDGLLPGIIRAILPHIASSIDLEVREVSISKDKLFEAREAFLTNSLMGIMPLVRIENTYIGNGVPGEIFRALSKNLWEYFTQSIQLV